MNNQGQWTSITIGVVTALFVVWMQRHQRWTYFFDGLAGRLVIVGSRAGGSTSSTPSTPSTPTTPAKPGLQGPTGPVQEAGISSGVTLV